MTPAESAVLASGSPPPREHRQSPSGVGRRRRVRVLLSGCRASGCSGSWPLRSTAGRWWSDRPRATISRPSSDRCVRIVSRFEARWPPRRRRQTRFGLLRRAGSEAYVFKGLATAHLDDTTRRTERSTTPTCTWRGATSSARSMPWTASDSRRAPTPMSRRWQRRFARACEMRSSDGVELDLHAAVATGYFGVRLDHDRLRSDRERVVLGGETVSVFSAPARALISCYGVVLSRGPGPAPAARPRPATDRARRSLARAGGTER